MQKEVSELKHIRQPLIPVEKVRIRTKKRFQHLQNENDENEESIYMYDDDVRGEITNSYPAVNNRIVGITATQTPKRPQVVVKNNPEREPYFKKTVPGNANYADITKEGKKTCIIGASIVKRIRMWEFNKFLENGNAIKHSFPGATAKN